MSELVYVGIGTSYLWPWNCFITASMFIGPYLQDYPGLQRSYSSCVMLASTMINLSVSTYLAMHPKNFGWRVWFGQFMIGLGFLILSLLTWLNVAPKPYFYLILFFVCFISVGTTNVQNGVNAITQAIPGGKEARAVLIGQALSGIVPPIFGLALSLSGSDKTPKAGGPDPNTNDLVVETIQSLGDLGTRAIATLSDNPAEELRTVIVLFLSSFALCAYVLYSFRGKTVESHIELSQEENVLEDSAHSLKDLAFAIKAPALSIFMGFMVSLSFTVFVNYVESRHIKMRYFVPLNMLLWNAGDLGGRIMCESARFQINNPRTLVTYAYARILFIPLLLIVTWLNNPSDTVYSVIMTLYGITNGHLISASISYTPLCVAPEQRSSAGGLIGMVISLGLVSGALASFLVIPLLTLF